MALGFITITLTPSADVDTNDTMDFLYPAGYDAAALFAQSGEKLVISGLGNVLDQAANTFTVAYDADSATVTYEDATSIPAGTAVTLQLPLADFEDVTSLTDGSLGTASDTLPEITAAYVEADIANSIASLAAKVNTLVARVNSLLALSQDRDNVPNDDRN